jgi:PleD family two-component response regulator
MSNKERSFLVTASGRQAWESQDPSVPEDYRRILWLMDFHSKEAVVGELLKRYPAKVLDEWLGEMAHLGLIQATADSSDKSAFSARAADRTKTVSKAELKRKGEVASEHLTHTGAYIAADRLSVRPPTAKSPKECVVLIVEDDPDQLAMAELRVGMAGYEVRVASTVNAFLYSMLDDGAPDLLLLDVFLPDGNGFELLEKLRRNAVLGSLPIVMLTAENKPEYIGKGLLLGADGYIIKPYTKNILADVIRQVLKHESGG